MTAATRAWMVLVLDLGVLPALAARLWGGIRCSQHPTARKAGGD